MKRQEFVRTFAKELQKTTGLKASKVTSEDMPTFRMVVEVDESIFTFEAPFNGLTKKFMTIQAEKIGKIVEINNVNKTN